MRLQLALNVEDIDAAIGFYSKLFGAEPARRRPGYANFAIDEPPLKLVLFEAPGAGGTVNHLGVETETAEEVVAAEQRLRTAGLETTSIDDTLCCYAGKTETWVTDTEGIGWEWYVRTGDSETFENVIVGSRPRAGSHPRAESCCP